MTITEQQLAFAVKALGVELLYNENRNAGTKIIQVGDKYEAHPFGPGFAEWAVPVLEDRHKIFFLIYYYDGKWFIKDDSTCDDLVNGPDIDTAVFLLAAKIGEGME